MCEIWIRDKQWRSWIKITGKHRCFAATHTDIEASFFLQATLIDPLSAGAFAEVNFSDLHILSIYRFIWAQRWWSKKMGMGWGDASLKCFSQWRRSTEICCLHSHFVSLLRYFDATDSANSVCLWELPVHIFVEDISPPPPHLLISFQLLEYQIW